MAREYSNLPDLSTAALDIIAAYQLITTSTADAPHAHVTYEQLRTFTDLPDTQWDSALNELERHGIAMTAHDDTGSGVLVFTVDAQQRSPQWVLDAARVSHINEGEKRRHDDGLTLIARESRRRGFSNDGKVSAAVWHAATEIQRYGLDGQRMATGTPAAPALTLADAVSHVPDTVWLEAGAHAGREYELTQLCDSAHRQLSEAHSHHTHGDTHRADQYARAAHSSALEVSLDSQASDDQRAHARHIIDAAPTLYAETTTTRGVARRAAELASRGRPTHSSSVTHAQPEPPRAARRPPDRNTGAQRDR